jgi:hypothetical protein
MSTQRRANRATPATTSCRREPRHRRRTTGCKERAESVELFSSAFSAQFDRAHASGRTAPAGIFPSTFHSIEKEMSLGILEHSATNSLQTDYRNTQLVRLVPVNNRHGSPPAGAGILAAAVTLKSFGSSFPHIPSTSGHARLHPSLPRVPAALSCRTERYDGKRNLYFQHAA